MTVKVKFECLMDPFVRFDNEKKDPRVYHLDTKLQNGNIARTGIVVAMRENDGTMTSGVDMGNSDKISENG